METLEIAKGPPIFSCEKCNYFTCKKNHFLRHVETKKHKMLVLEINGNEKGAKKGIEISVCEKCNKEFKSNIENLGDGFYVLIEYMSNYENINFCNEYI